MKNNFIKIFSIVFLLSTFMAWGFFSLAPSDSGCHHVSKTMNSDMLLPCCQGGHQASLVAPSFNFDFYKFVSVVSFDKSLLNLKTLNLVAFVDLKTDPPQLISLKTIVLRV